MWTLRSTPLTCSASSPACPSTTTSTPKSLWGQELLDLHINFDSADPYPLERVEKSNLPGKTALRADMERGAIVLDATTLTGVPETAWDCCLGSHSAL